MNPKFIVSANYRNRKAPLKWLVRRADEPESKAREVASVRCFGVSFEPSENHGIAGWGFACKAVAVCDQVVEDVPPASDGTPGEKLVFDTSLGQFYRTQPTVLVKTCEVLDLHEDGAVWSRPASVAEVKDAAGETIPAEEVEPATPAQIITRNVKSIRQQLDGILQYAKAFRASLQTGELSLEGVENPNELHANLILSIRHTEDAIMRGGMALKAIGATPNPYPDSYNPASPVIEKTADGLKL